MARLFSAKLSNDLSIYELHAKDWWNPRSPYFRSLQGITPFRLELIKRWFGDVREKKIFDLGCGGGLLALPLINLGANIVGVDLSPASIAQASKQTGGRGTFICADIGTFEFPDRQADAVLLADVLDHIPDYANILEKSAALLKPGGKLFVSTINRTWQAWIMAIVLGEGLRLIPPGTHAHSLFIRPQELIDAAAKFGLVCKEVTGDRVQLLPTILNWAISMCEGKSLAVSYSVLFERRL